MKIRRNTPCPCGSGKKHKHCCEGQRDWETIFQSSSALVRNLTIRGKNLLFLDGLAGILDLDPAGGQIDWPALKSRITEDHVAAIFSLVRDIWPNGHDLNRVLADAGDLPGVYTGSYVPESVTQGLARHSLYSDTILMFDPFIYPGNQYPEYDPLQRPDRYVSNTIKCLYIWLSLSSWIYAGILKMIRSPSDFDSDLRWDSWQEENRREKDHPELRNMIEEMVKNPDTLVGDPKWMREYILLSSPDDVVVEQLSEGGYSKPEIESFLRYRESKKRAHPYYTERRQDELHISSFGECHSVARRVANTVGGFMLTDSSVKWRMIELERKDTGADLGLWEPFASAVQRTDLKYLDGIPLNRCLELRQDGLLDGMRTFLRQVWSSSRTDGDFSRAAAEQFAGELDAQVAVADAEWRKIDTKLAQWFVGEVAAGLATAPSIGLANAGWVGASLVVLGGAHLADAHRKRRNLPERLPGAFFIEPRRTHLR